MKMSRLVGLAAVVILILLFGLGIRLGGLGKPESLEEVRVDSKALPHAVHGSSPMPVELPPELPKTVRMTPTLADRLESFRMLLRQQQLAEKLSAAERLAAWRRIDDLWPDLHAAIFADPESYRRYLQSIESELDCEGLIGILSSAHLSPPASPLLAVGMNPLPRPVLEGLRDLLVSGGDGQKIAVLKMVERTLHMDVNSYKPFVEQSRELFLAQGSPQVRAAALGVLVAKSRESLDPYFDLVQTLARNSADAETELNCLAAAARMRRQDAEVFLTNEIRELVDGRGVQPEMRILQELIGLVEMKLVTVPGDRADRYADLIGLGLRRAPDPATYRGWTSASLGLPTPRMVPLLQEAQARAPSPELREAAQRVLTVLQSGDSRVASLKKAFEGK